MSAKAKAALERERTACINRLEKAVAASVRDDLRERIANIDAALSDLQAQGEGDPVAWRYRWTNPMNDPNRERDVRWEPVETKYAGQTIEQRIEELRSYESDRKPQYEVQPLYTRPASAPDITGLVADGELPVVGGRFLTECTLSMMERRLLVQIQRAQKMHDPGNALLATLCDAVRTVREYIDRGAARFPAQGEKTYTKQEVEAVFSDCKMIARAVAQVDYPRPEAALKVIDQDFAVIARKHGINTDTHG